MARRTQQTPNPESAASGLPRGLHATIEGEAGSRGRQRSHKKGREGSAKDPRTSSTRSGASGMIVRACENKPSEKPCPLGSKKPDLLRRSLLLSGVDQRQRLLAFADVAPREVG